MSFNFYNDIVPCFDDIDPYKIDDNGNVFRKTDTEISEEITEAMRQSRVFDHKYSWGDIVHAYRYAYAAVREPEHGQARWMILGDDKSGSPMELGVDADDVSDVNIACHAQPADNGTFARVGMTKKRYQEMKRKNRWGSKMAYTKGDGTYVSDSDILAMHEDFLRGISNPSEFVPGPAFSEFVRKVDSGEIELPGDDSDYGDEGRELAAYCLFA